MKNKKTVLLLTDFTKRAEKAADLALQIAVTNHADLLIYNSVIVLQSDILTGKAQSAAKEIAAKTDSSIYHLNKLAAYLNGKLSLKQAAGTKITLKEGMGSVISTIANLVAEHDVWMVVMGNHVEKDQATMYTDSNVPAVMNNCGCPLLLVP